MGRPETGLGWHIQAQLQKTLQLAGLTSPDCLVFPGQSDTVQHLVGGGGGAPLAGGKASETARPGRSLTEATDGAQVTHTSGGEVLGAQRMLG